MPIQGTVLSVVPVPVQSTVLSAARFGHRHACCDGELFIIDCQQSVRDGAGAAVRTV